MNALTTIFAIGIGATIGASLRYYLGLWIGVILGTNFPYGTLFANVLGSFLAGILLVIIVEKSLLSETYRLLLIIGLCGSLTTFSTLSLDTLALFNLEQYAQAGINIALNFVLSITGTLVGIILTRYFLN